MTHSRRHVHRSALPTLFLMFGLAMVSPDLALASKTDVYGGAGGNYFWADCPKGSYLVGLAGEGKGDRLLCLPRPSAGPQRRHETEPGCEALLPLG
jgi:hypothetical protein